MLDARIYRHGMMIVALALIVVAFSLGSQPDPLSATLVPDAFNGSGAYTTMSSLAARYPDRAPGSDGDNHVADYVAGALSGEGLLVRRSAFTAQTVDGPRTIQTVTGILAGTTPGTIVVVAHRDAPPPATGGATGAATGSAADLSGTAVLLELGHVLSAQSQQRSVVLASTSAQIGAAGAAQLASSLPGPVDAVIVLGDLAGLQAREPIVLPWSDTQLVAPPLLRNTAAEALSQQANLTSLDESLGGQFLHLAFPLASTEQRPFAAAGDPAVLISASGSHLPAADEPTSPDQMTRFGRAVLQTVGALEAGASVPGPSSYLRWQDKLIPAWAIRVLVLALILPVLVATIDVLARARRRGHRVARWIPWVLSACVPFVLAVLAVLVLRATGVIAAAPLGPVPGEALTLPGNAIPTLAGLAITIVLAFMARWRIGRHLWTPTAPAAPPTPATPTTSPTPITLTTSTTPAKSAAHDRAGPRPGPAGPGPGPAGPEAGPGPAEPGPGPAGPGPGPAGPEPGPGPAEPGPAGPAPTNGRRHARRPATLDDAASPGAAAAFLLVLCLTTFVIWVKNPFAAALIIPALHFWMWIVAPERRPRAPLAALLFAAGLAPGVLAVAYYAHVLGLGPVAAAWNAVLMLAGGSVSVMSAIEWSVVLGCVLSLALMIVRIARQPRARPAETPITVRGPITYAGPGSLGGTKSALRR